MTWAKGRKRRDPLLIKQKHRNHNRAHWQRLRLPCARCGEAIDYDGPQYLRDGSRNPRYLVVGHIVGRLEALALGWTGDQINDLTNTQPECLDCSNKSGSQAGVQMRNNNRITRVPLAAPEASNW